MLLMSLGETMLKILTFMEIYLESVVGCEKGVWSLLLIVGGVRNLLTNLLLISCFGLFLME